MPQYLSPGVYVEEVDSGSRPIEGVGTAVAAFVGLATRGPYNTPTLISNWTQFSSTFGEFAPGTYLAHAVFGYFMNGGGNCYVVRIGDDGKGSSSTPSPNARANSEPPKTPVQRRSRNYVRSSQIPRTGYPTFLPSLSLSCASTPSSSLLLLSFLSLLAFALASLSSTTC